MVVGWTSHRLSGSFWLCGPGSGNETEEKALVERSFIQLINPINVVFASQLIASLRDAVTAALQTNHNVWLPPGSTSEDPPPFRISGFCEEFYPSQNLCGIWVFRKVATLRSGLRSKFARS